MIIDDTQAVIDLTAINARYDEKSFFRRFGEMVVGLGRPRATREYKLARIELQRLVAPFIAIVSVVLFIVVLIVMTAVSGQAKKVIEVQIAQIEEDEPDLEEQIDEPPPDEIEPPPEDLDIVVDVPNPGPVSQLTPQAVPTKTTQVSVKPATQDAVAFIDSPVTMKDMVGSRTPGSIGAATRGGVGYGDATTEACVMKCLWYLKHTQITDERQKHLYGTWKGDGRSPLANAGFAVLAFLAHGEYPGSPSPYRKDFGPVVQRALSYLIGCASTSDPIKLKGEESTMYAFVIATYALCEAYGMTRNPNCRDVALRCMDRIVKGQKPTGGWDYEFKRSERDDLSLSAWALQALKAGKMAGLHPEGLDACIKKAVRCFITRLYDKEGFFNYSTIKGDLPNRRGMTAPGCLALQLLGYGDAAEVKGALNYMRDWKPSFDKDFAPNAAGKDLPGPQYYCYYVTQCKYQAGMRKGAIKADMESWQKWNLAMKKLYPSLIIDLPEKTKDWSGKEHKMGYFQNNDAYSARPLMDTSLAALQLMVYYRYLPTSQTKAGETEGEKLTGAEAATDKNLDVSVEVDI